MGRKILISILIIFSLFLCASTISSPYDKEKPGGVSPFKEFQIEYPEYADLKCSVMDVEMYGTAIGTV